MTPQNALQLHECARYDASPFAQRCPWVEVEAARIDGVQSNLTTRMDGLEKNQVSLEHSVTRIEGKIDSLKNWMMGAMATFTIGIVLGIFNLVLKSPK